MAEDIQSEDDTTDGHDHSCENSPPPTPKDPIAEPEPVKRGETASKLSQAKKASVQRPKHKQLKVDTLTAEEQVMDSSSDEDPNQTQSKSTQRWGVTRPPVSRRALDPVPLIDPLVVCGKDLKHLVATSMQLGIAAKLEML
ncbi:uncharacterized protein MELLADRAFT_61570 [Melampsora larici-populina 98AG31]|uniref:Uncharacterized protein n=1 Tax=Melampsora larici-populina (strain 98AG31 / pathotype 3-4-7) TaxID=747676 RepID=F4RFG2_MELLP|nr:uncharacterized protein MELLADRAFT_61570 [Melampsora larici-populina 98AG31]EGG08936.1 hypothetical protein MELLADRAFT_61570 [Melampsora larici-populina 98AG31]